MRTRRYRSSLLGPVMVCLSTDGDLRDLVNDEIRAERLVTWWQDQASR
ncbi:hypothetical protein FB565_008874 [Actinoplanes lutulentus]|uniref:Uncharacterized protein n=1 Tax=Actinoplanes lutulentus TaxID=1287878 RepID=A0A327Z4Y3_9ACTN|nr:hypothetical protein [Actinoplanes lutulentus]RAK31391.1 hypothetical protein B0I29_115198 [Actinoplanes lutulentus]